MSEPQRLTNEQIVEIYAANEEEIFTLWGEMGGTCREAVEEWLRQQETLPKSE